MFKRKIPPPTPEQQARQDRARELGCIACRMAHVRQPLPSTIHHQNHNFGGGQIGQDETVCLCQWHHQGVCLENLSSTAMTMVYGPSLAKGSKPFYARFGSNEEQLLYQNRLIYGAQYQVDETRVTWN